LTFYKKYDIIKEKIYKKPNGNAIILPFGIKNSLPPYILYNIFYKKSNKIAKKRPICHDFLEKRTSFHLTIFLFYRWAPGSNRDDKKWKGISPEKRISIADETYASVVKNLSRGK
jgi:hypothetical protein